MKKTFYTIAFLSLMSFAAQAQTTENKVSQDPARKEAKPANTNADGTMATESKGAPATTTEKSKEQASPPKDGTRMAITEKGLPAKKKTKTEPK